MHGYLSYEMEDVVDDDRYGEQNEANNGHGPSRSFLQASSSHVSELLPSEFLSMYK